MLGRLAICVLVAGVLVAVAVEIAAACSPEFGDRDLRAELADADAAFVGVVVSRREPGPVGIGNVTYTFRVDAAVKGSFGQTVDVATAPNSAACGLGAKVGDRVGLFLHGSAVRWTAWLDDQVEPNRLIALWGGAPSPISRPGSPSVPEMARSNGYVWLALPAAAAALAAAAGIGAALRRRRPKTQG